MTDTSQAIRAETHAGLSDRNSGMLLDHVAGKTLEAIAEQHAISHQRVSEIVRREERRYLDQLELDLMVASKVGVGHPQFFVPFDDEDAWQRSMCEFVWALTRLRRDRQARISVTTQQTSEGTTFMLEPKETK